MNALKFRTLIFLLVCTQIGRAGDPLDNWTWRNPLPTGEALLGITYGNSQFVAVGGGGAVQNLKGRSELGPAGPTRFAMAMACLWRSAAAGIASMAPL